MDDTWDGISMSWLPGDSCGHWVTNFDIFDGKFSSSWIVTCGSSATKWSQLSPAHETRATELLRLSGLENLRKSQQNSTKMGQTHGTFDVFDVHNLRPWPFRYVLSLYGLGFVVKISTSILVWRLFFTTFSPKMLKTMYENVGVCRPECYNMLQPTNIESSFISCVSLYPLWSIFLSSTMGSGTKRNGKLNVDDSLVWTLCEDGCGSLFPPAKMYKNEKRQSNDWLKGIWRNQSFLPLNYSRSI